MIFIYIYIKRAGRAFHAWSERAAAFTVDMWEELHRRVVRSYIYQCLSRWSCEENIKRRL